MASLYSPEAFSAGSLHYHTQFYTRDIEEFDGSLRLVLRNCVVVGFK